MAVTTERRLALGAIIGFAVLTIAGVVNDGLPGGAVDAITFNTMSWQIYIDLVLAIIVLSIWIHRDATRRGTNPWPYIAGGVIAGMFGPLFYLLLRPDHPEDRI